jgi:glutamyl-tRNA synthetase
LFSENFWNAVKGNIATLSEVRYWYDIFFKDIAVVKEDETFVRQMLQTLNSEFDFAQWIAELKNVSGRKGKDLFHPIRVVLTGVDKGPELAKIADLIGYERLKSRIEANLKAN